MNEKEISKYEKNKIRVHDLENYIYSSSSKLKKISAYLKELRELDMVKARQLESYVNGLLNTNVADDYSYSYLYRLYLIEKQQDEENEYQKALKLKGEQINE